MPASWHVAGESINRVHFYNKLNCGQKRKVMPAPKAPPPPSPDPDEPVWTYRGYRLKTSEFVTAMVHFFRAEIQRANVWRQRLDTTTNWAVVVTGATLSIAFSQPD